MNMKIVASDEELDDSQVNDQSTPAENYEHNQPQSPWLQSLPGSPESQSSLAGNSTSAQRESRSSRGWRDKYFNDNELPENATDDEIAAAETISKLNNAICFIQAGQYIENELEKNGKQLSDLDDENLRSEVSNFINAKNEFIEFFSGLNFPDP